MSLRVKGREQGEQREIVFFNENIMTIQSFRDILSWQKSREQTNLIYDFTKKEQFSKDFALKDQMRRASVSVMSNIAEGFARRTDNEFRHFLYIAYGSNTELQSQLFIALDQKYISEQEFQKAFDLSEEISKLIMNFIKYLKNTLDKNTL